LIELKSKKFTNYIKNFTKAYLKAGVFINYQFFT